MQTISVNTICQDEAETLPYMLHCVERVLLPFLKEVVIVDGGSEDETVAVAESYMDRLPIIILHRPYDSPGVQKNFGLERCTGDWVMGFDADNVVTSNFATLFAAGAFNSKTVWDMVAHELVVDEYHHDPASLGGPTTRFWKNIYRYEQLWHEQLKYKPEEKAFCSEVAILEHALLQTPEKLLQRGERWQKWASTLSQFGPGPGGPRRYIDGEKEARGRATLLPDKFGKFMVPRDSELLREIDRRRIE
jgi:hypothetical protein